MGRTSYIIHGEEAASGLGAENMETLPDKEGARNLGQEKQGQAILSPSIRILSLSFSPGHECIAVLGSLRGSSLNNFF